METRAKIAELKNVGKRLIQYPSGKLAHIECACGCGRYCYAHANPYCYNGEWWAGMCLITYLAGKVEGGHGQS